MHPPVLSRLFSQNCWIFDSIFYASRDRSHWHDLAVGGNARNQVEMRICLAAGLDREQLLDAIAPHIIEQARTVGTYEL
jgi:hypothetical protein